MILVNHYGIWPPIPKTIFIKHCRVKIIACPFVLFHNNRFFNVCCLFRQRFFAAYLLKLFLLPQRAHITLFINGVTTLSLLVGVCAACMLAYRCLQMKWWAAVTVVAIPSQKALLMCPYVSNFQCLHRVVLVPFCIIYSLHLIVV